MSLRPSDGLAFNVWVDDIEKLLEESGLAHPSMHEYRRFYNINLSVEEVVNKVQFKKVRSAWMQLHVRYEGGDYTTTFNTSAQAKEYFKKFPELREKLDEL